MDNKDKGMVDKDSHRLVLELVMLLQLNLLKKANQMDNDDHSQGDRNQDDRNQDGQILHHNLIQVADLLIRDLDC